jgi:hypothetical protein
LLQAKDSGRSVAYGFAPGLPELDAAVDELARMYVHSRFDVVSWIMAHAVTRIRREAGAAFGQLIRAKRNDGS